MRATEIHKSANPRLPEPSAYTRYLERIAKRQETDLKLARRKKLIEWFFIVAGSASIGWSAILLWRALP